jgi:nucleoside-diphosphate-sugar epimerase
MILFTGGGAIADEFRKLYKCEIISARSLSDEVLETWVSRARVIIHNAALINSVDLNELTTSNFLLTKKLIDLSLKLNPGVKFVNISSMSILENEETYLDPLSMTPYAFSKYISELYCIKNSLENLISIRFSTIFYKRDKDGISQMISNAVYKNEIQLFNHGLAKRDIIPINIAVQYLFHICNNTTDRKIINVVSGYSTSFFEIAQIIKKQINLVNIKNQVVESKTVLHNFSNKNLLQFGLIDFNLEDEVISYIRKLMV